MSNHGSRKFTIDQFPLKEEGFKNTFDGGAPKDNGYKMPASYYESIGGGNLS